MSVSSHTDTHSTSVPSASSASAHATGVADSGRWSTRRIAVYALFVALSMAVSFIEFPLIPGVPWLKYDPSGIVCLVAGFAYASSGMRPHRRRSSRGGCTNGNASFREGAIPYWR